MIAFVRGQVEALTLTSAVVAVGGVGMQVWCTPGTLAALRVGDQATLHTSLVVREDSLTLYGFASIDERDVFELLQTASGVGPKVAQAMLAVHDPDMLRRAVSTEDLATLTAVPGIGRKGAQRIVLELKDRLGPPLAPTESASGNGQPDGPWRDQVRTALVGLGWSVRDADGALDKVAPDVADTPDVDVAAVLKAALRTLSKA